MNTPGRENTHHGSNKTKNRSSPQKKFPIERTIYAPNWFKEELDAFKPPDKTTVAEWADRNRVMDSSSPQPGRWHTDNTPYLKEPMEKFTDNVINKIVMCFGTQLGKTETIFNALGYVIDQAPAPAMYVMPTKDAGKNISGNRIVKMLKKTECLSEKFLEDKSKALELQFTNMYLNLVGSNSAAELASKPMKYLFLDEVDKFPGMASGDSDPRLLAEERLKAHPDAREIEVSSPTYETGNIWQDYKGTDVQKKYVVQCPSCGKWIELIFKQIKWPEDCASRSEVRDKAIYVCQECGSPIYDHQKRQMLRGGKWIDVKKPKSNVYSIGYHLSSLYSPWLTWGKIAEKFVSCKDVPSKLKGFINGWLAEPWKNLGHEVALDAEFAVHEWGRAVVPPDTELLIMSVDVQKTHFWYEIRGWNANYEGRLIDFGQVITWKDIANIVENRDFRDTTGRKVYLDKCMIDSGYRTDEVYDFVSAHFEVCMACKGASKRMPMPYRISNIDRNKDKNKVAYGSLNVVVIDTEYWKDYVSSRQRYKTGVRGAMEIFMSCPSEYTDQQKSEVKRIIQDPKTGQETEMWVKISEHIRNHLFDTCSMNAVGADICGVRYLGDGSEEGEQSETGEEKEMSDNWIQGSEW